MNKKIGRPPKYNTAEELEIKVNEYFNNPPDKRKIILKDGQTIDIPVLTITGLVLYLGFCDRHSFYDLEKNKKFSHTIKKARTLIEREYEKLLQAGLGAGAIFALKNFKWIDTPLIEQHAHYNMFFQDMIDKYQSAPERILRYAADNRS